MSKHIDAEVMINELRVLRAKYLIQSVFGEDMRDNAVIAGALEAVAQILDGLPAADVVEVVRCRECRYREQEQPGMVYCPNTVGGWVDEDWFCAGGDKE